MPQVRRRCVFYVSGFDPKGAAHYHALYCEEAAAQARSGGLALEVSPRRRLPDGNAAWSVRAVEDGVTVETHYEFMRWDHVVRQHWQRRRRDLWRATWAASLFHLRHGSLWRIFQLAWPAALALLIPFLVVAGLTVAGPLLAGLAGWAAAHLAGSWIAAVPAVLLVLVALGRGERAMDDRFNMYWLMRSYAFTRLQALGRTPELEAVLDAHARKLAQRLAAREDDEVLVVGHSSGAIMAATIVARALRLRAEEGDAGPRLSLLTLGQCIPMLAALPQAVAFRAELAELGRAPGLQWVDFSAPPDASCVPLSNPLAEADVLGAQAPVDVPKLLSPRFAAMFDPEAYRLLRQDKLRMHFQYLMAAPRPVEYDYFRITAGAQTLAGRFAHLRSVTDFDRLRPLRRRRRA